MKKALTLLLAVLLVGSLGLIAVACDDEGGDTTTTVTMEEATTTTQSGPLTVAAVKAIGEQLVADYKADGEVSADIPTYTAGTVTFEGPVYSVSKKSDKFLVNIGVEGETFTLAFFFTDLETIGYTNKASLEALIGMNVAVTGEVVLNPFGGGAEIVIKDATQVVPAM